MKVIMLATVLAHAGLLMVKGAEIFSESTPRLAPIQLTAFSSTGAPFVPGLPSMRPAKAARPKVTTQSAKPKFIAPAVAKTDVVTTQESAIDAGPASGSGGVASTISSAGMMATGDLRQIYLSELRARLEEVKHYPQQARRLGQTGSVEVAFMVHPDGKIDEARIVRPSPFKRLNESALATVATLKKFRPLPEGFDGNPLTVTLPIRYTISN